MIRTSSGISRRWNPVVLLVIADAAVIFGSFFLAAWLRFGMEIQAAVDSLDPVLPRALAFSVFVMMGLVATGLYRGRQRPRLWEAIARVIVAVGIGGFGDILFFYAFPDLDTGRGVLMIAMVLACVTLSVTRVLLLRVFDFNPLKRRILVFGAGEVASYISVLRRRADRRRFEIVGYMLVNESDRDEALARGLENLLPLTTDIDTLDVDEIVVALDNRRGAFPAARLLKQKFRGVPVVDIIEFLETETGKIDLDVLYPGWLVFADSCNTDGTFRSVKRFLDITMGSMLMLLTTPLAVLVALSMWIEDGFGAPVFYRQKRVGRGGKHFDLFKFRSMCIHAESESGAVWSRENDDRITQVGKVMRRFRLDELPQLWNVVRGDMSIVGPRPERPEFVDKLKDAIPMYEYRHCVRPGLSGWAQLNYPYGASVADSREKFKYDLYYIKNTNVMFDLFVLLQTIEVVIWGRGISMAGACDADGLVLSSSTDAQLQLFSRKKQDNASQELKEGA